MLPSLRSLIASGTIAVSLVGFGGAIRPTFASQYIGQIEAQIAAAANQLITHGFQIDRPLFVDNLGNRGTEDLSLDLCAGEEYVIVGVCDEDCGDLDLKLYDDSGHLIASDNAADGTPIVHISPKWSAGFTLRTEMASCGANPCQYGIGVLSR